MFRLFGRAQGKQPHQRVEPHFSQSQRTGDAGAAQHERAGALPEVREGNAEHDWALWERAVVALDREVQERRRERAVSATGEAWEKWLRN